MPFPIYLRRLRFRELKPEITLLEKKQHWGRSWKAFLEITTLFEFLLHVLKFSGEGQQREETIFAAKARLQFMHQEATGASLQFCRPCVNKDGSLEKTREGLPFKRLHKPARPLLQNPTLTLKAFANETNLREITFFPTISFH